MKSLSINTYYALVIKHADGYGYCFTKDAEGVEMLKSLVSYCLSHNDSVALNKFLDASESVTFYDGSDVVEAELCGVNVYNASVVYVAKGRAFVVPFEDAEYIEV